MVGRRSFPFGARPIFRCELLVLGSVLQQTGLLERDWQNPKTPQNKHVLGAYVRVRYFGREIFVFVKPARGCLWLMASSITITSSTTSILNITMSPGALFQQFLLYQCVLICPQELARSCVGVGQGVETIRP